MDALRLHLRDVVGKAFGHAAPTLALILFDRRSALARILAEGYRAAIPHAAFLDFDEVSEEEVMSAIGALPPRSLAVLIQSTRFDVGEFRFRLELFRRGLHVIEHPHVGRMRDVEIPIYVDALAYDPRYLRTLGRALKARIDVANEIRVTSAHGSLVYGGPFEDAKLNVGDYTGFANVGGQFPIGEVFTEPVELEAVSGVASIGAFGAGDFSVTFPEQPFALRIERGRVVGTEGGPPEFDALLREIAAEEGQVWVRELGFGINRAMTRTRRVHDVSTYERMCGLHLSLGAKHAVYPKPGFSKRRARFHVDVFCWADRVDIDGDVVFTGEAYVV